MFSRETDINIRDVNEDNYFFRRNPNKEATGVGKQYSRFFLAGGNTTFGTSGSEGTPMALFVSILYNTILNIFPTIGVGKL